MNELFKVYDGLMIPRSCNIVLLFGEVTDRLLEEYLILGNYLCVVNFGEYPSISTPSGFVSSMPVGINITGIAKEDVLVLIL
jgi:Asp-tRNA(Asn)/Glu-tRNA(Gln) amidotransferase A subunit family amidase